MWGKKLFKLGYLMKLNAKYVLPVLRAGLIGSLHEI